MNSIWKKWKSFSVDEDLRKKTIAKYSGIVTIIFDDCLLS
jgi:hypothetical protein